MNIAELMKKNRDKFIEENKKFIYNAAYKTCKRTLDWANDEELSIALIAFNNACNNYNEKKGNFFSYTSVIIKNSLIDFFRKSKNTPYLLFDDANNEMDEDNYIDYKVSLNQYEIDIENQKRAEEIALFSKELAKYKLSFNDLIKSSPSHIDTRNNLLNLALTCSNNEDILKYIKEKRLLPVSQIALLTGAKKKYIEKWRRYILTLILILSSNEYPYIKSYLNIKVGENDA
ncbi:MULTISPECIES: sigma factor [Clostridium]|uniref:RNA polymerase sigma factor SigI n=2 Tax=Clostridium TaxID=1485 RepID=A0A151APT4_9CLOT|nr:MULTISPECIES: sigma factor [Clostridium]KYH29651.1 RNA polymerase sigma factor SigI [Clostridium colicanis DSM 13634]PRR72102.1 RNA polymerase sigma factor SigI [Clostridium thermopalmarium DSM 5974]PVZ23754.1 RNA polymerase sigma factor [Clostridium thermopalmarium DSM 5974]